MRFILPRTIKANRGDLASRWALISTLSQKGFTDTTVFIHAADDAPQNIQNLIPYGPFYNALPPLEGWKSLLKSDVVIWGVGLDIQDDASLMKLLYLFVFFRLYRLLGLEIWVLFQGAGPLERKAGRALAKGVLKCVSVFVARDPKTLSLINSLKKKTDLRLGHDAIFLPGLEKDLAEVSKVEKEIIDKWFGNQGAQLYVGFNIRQCFIFHPASCHINFLKTVIRTVLREKWMHC
jgi:polysaccharide pyruvyl transferase WcaK-like protein